MQAGYNYVGVVVGLLLSGGAFAAPPTAPATASTVAVVQAVATAPTAPRSAAEILSAEVEEALQVLDRAHFSVEAGAAGAAIEAAARTVDPGARLLAGAQAEHLKQERSGLDYGFDVRLAISNGQPVVVEDHPSDPSRAGGLQVGDRLVSIGDLPATNLTLPRALAVLRDHQTSTVSLVVQRADAVITSVATRVLTTLQPIESSEKWSRELAYMKLNGLYEPDAGRSVVSTLRGWSETGRFGFILDLRGATGNDLAAVQAIGSLFAPAGSLLFSIRDRQDQDVSTYKALSGDPLKTPVVVLVDEGTSGAAEVLAAVLADSVRGALVIGEATAGDPLIRDVVSLPNQRNIYLATRRLVTADGAIYDGHAGLPPDVVAPRVAADADYYEPEAMPDRRATLPQEGEDRAMRDRWRGDPALRQAVDLLLGLKALNIRADGVSSK